ncbi:MAG: universal stress protein [Hyphomicrobiales bacterium]|nr:universal stress protein [Hyphomicrobiales bacterium]MCP5370868.1 universal stress protein [Hyphomicrobiales bacterium]
MPIRTILVPADGTDASKPAIEMALKLAPAFHAHVEVLHVRADAKDAVPLLGEGMSGAMIEEMIDMAETEAAQRAKAARAMFDSTCGAQSIPVKDAADGVEEASISWREETGREDEVTATRALLADMIVMTRPGSESEVSATLTLNAALFESARPVLLAPHEGASLPTRHAVIAWNGSAQAARAVRTAMPLMKKMDAVTVVTIDARGEVTPTAADVAAYLAWHGIQAQVRSKNGEGPGMVLLNVCREVDADLLVMGAYTHSRLRQLIMGGVTRFVLDNAKIPVLMAH